MLTHKIINKEASELKRIIESGDVEIPFFWRCAYPGILVMLWLTIFPFFTFGLYKHYSDDGVMAVCGGAFIGFLFFVIMTGTITTYMSIPEQFRKNSKVIIFFRKKAACYVSFILFISFISSLIAPGTIGGAVVYIFPIFIFTFISLFIYIIDIGRYRLSAFTSVLALIKSHKQQGGGE